MPDVDWDRLHEWAINDATDRGCSCDEEPDVEVEFCEDHGLHVVHLHEERCYITMTMNAKWN